MTVDKANELRLKTIDLPYMEGHLYDPDNEDKDVINVTKEGKVLSVLDVGFAIPKLGFCKDMFELFYYMKPKSTRDFHFEYWCPSSIKEAICITSTVAKRKKSIISKRNFNFEGKKICLFGMVDDDKLYVWKSGTIWFKDGSGDEGYELSILNDKLQIENRAYYIRVVRD
jgi:hypothetical protein